jgi:hypothetical protein
MEIIILQMFEWNLQLPTPIEILQTFLAQGVVFENDYIIKENKNDD